MSYFYWSYSSIKLCELNFVTSPEVNRLYYVCKWSRRTHFKCQINRVFHLKSILFTYHFLELNLILILQAMTCLIDSLTAGMFDMVNMLISNPEKYCYFEQITLLFFKKTYYVSSKRLIIFKEFFINHNSTHNLGFMVYKSTHSLTDTQIYQRNRICKFFHYFVIIVPQFESSVG